MTFCQAALELQFEFCVVFHMGPDMVVDYSCWSVAGGSRALVMIDDIDSTTYKDISA